MITAPGQIQPPKKFDFKESTQHSFLRIESAMNVKRRNAKSSLPVVGSFPYWDQENASKTTDILCWIHTYVTIPQLPLLKLSYMNL